MGHDIVESAEPGFPGRPSIWLGVLAVLASQILLGSAVNREARSQTDRASTPPAASSAEEIHALARLEPLSGLVVVGARPGARIDRIDVAQGDKVQAGQLLAILEGHDLAAAQLALAEANKARGLHQRDLEKRKLALEREKFDKLQKARNDMTLRVLASKALFDDITSTFKKLEPTLQGKERLETAMSYRAADAQDIRDALEVRSIQIAGELTKKQRELEDGELGEKSPDLDVLDRQIELAQRTLAQAEIHAPAAGMVLELVNHAGEVSSGPLLVMGDLSTMAAIAEVFQADVPRLRTGDLATVQILNQQVKGQVRQIGSMVTRNALTSLDPRALQDRRVIKVKVGLNDASLASRLVNMEVEVTISPGQSGTPATRAPHP